MAEQEPIDLGSITRELLDGLEVKSRDAGDVHTVKAGGRTVAEICVGARRGGLTMTMAAVSLALVGP